MQTHITKWGNSLGIRIPSSLAKQLNVTADTLVDLSIKDNHLIIQKIYHLEALIAQITPQNLHSEVDFSSPIGKENEK